MESLLNSEESLTKLNPIKYHLQKLYLSRNIHFIYGAMILLTIFSIIWVSVKANYHQEKWFISLELILCAFVTLDLCFRIYLIGPCLFIRSILNIVDILFTIICVVEIVIAVVDVVVKDVSTYIGLIILILRNTFMMIRIIILMKRSLTSNKNSPVIIENPEPPSKSMETILETNRENIKYMYRARLDTLGEEDEIYEDSLNQKHSVWTGRIKADRSKFEQNDE